MEDELKQKQIECDTIQRSFDEYVESSKELENELEIALTEAEAKANDALSQKAAAEEKCKMVQDKLSSLNKELSKTQSELVLLKENEQKQEQLRKTLESENEDLSNKIRILEATEEDLKHKLLNVEEDMVFLQGDLQELDVAKVELEESLKHQIESLQMELETVRVNGAESANTESGDVAEMESTINTLRSELDEASNKFLDLEATNNELLEELTKVTDEVIQLQQQLTSTAPPENDTYVQQLQEQNGQLEREAAFLRDQVEVKNQHIQDLLKGEESSELRDLAVRLDEREAELLEVRAQISSYIDISNTEKMDLVAEMSEKIHQLSQELVQLKANQVSASISTKSSAPSTINTTVSLNNPQGFSSASHSNGLEAYINSVIASGNVEAISAELHKMATDYEAVRRSNAQLLNKLQMLQGNIQVCCRTRPPSEQERAQGKICVDVADDTELLCYDSRMENWKTFKFDRVWRADAGQPDVFADVEPMITSVVEGYNVCIMAYGQTGSGKTFTMDGYGGQYGVSYRTIQRLFDLLAFRKLQAGTTSSAISSGSGDASAKIVSRGSKDNLSGLRKAPPTRPAVTKKISLSAASFEFSNPLAGGGGGSDGALSESSSAKYSVVADTLLGEEPLLVAEDKEDDIDGAEQATQQQESVFSYTVEISMMEIYNEQVYDLLHHKSGGGQADGVSLDIRQGPDNSITVPGLQQVAVNTIEDVMGVFSRGSANRATSSTNLNEHSSRSHLIILVDVTTKVGSELALRGKLHLVDLAGSERVGKSGVTGAAMKEAQYINKSLSALGDVMEALDQKSKHVPYRNSKLTYLLQNSLGGNSRTMMIVTVCPTDATFDETLFTLQFATRVRNISIGPAQKNSNAKNLEESLKMVRAELKDVKRKKQLLEDAVNDSKKELKKASERVAVPETKLKVLEDAKKAAETAAQQTTKQLNDTSKQLNDTIAALTGEKETREQLAADLEVTQRSLKKAVDNHNREARENERLSALAKTREKEIEALRTQLQKLSVGKPALEVLSASQSGKSEMPPPLAVDTHHSHGSKSSVSASATTVVPVTPVGSVSGNTSKSSPSPDRLNSAKRLNDLSQSPMLKANHVGSSLDFPSTDSAPVRSVSNKRSSVGAYANGTTSSFLRTSVMGPPVVTTLSKGSALEGGAARRTHQSLSSIPMRPTRTSLSKTGTPSSVSGADQQSQSISSGITGTVLFSAEKSEKVERNGSAVTSTLTKPPALSARSEEALKRHQARMEKKREAQALDKKRELMA